MSGREGNEAPPSAMRRWRVAAFFVVWTVFAAGVAWWLIHSAATEPAPVRPETLFDSRQAEQASVVQQIRGWLKLADLNFRGAYPWILLAPYVFWLASRFLIERSRLRLSLPVHVAACLLFVWMSSALTKRTVERLSVMIVRSDSHLARRGSGSGFGSSGGGGGVFWTNEIPELRGTNANGRDQMVTVQTYATPGDQIRTKVTVSSEGEVKTYDLPGPTNGSAATASLALAQSVLTNLNLPLRPGGLLDLGRKDAAHQPTGTAIGVFGPATSNADFHAPLEEMVGGLASMRSAGFQHQSRLFSMLLNVLAYGSLAGLAHAVHYYRRYRERERRAVFLESHLARARLHALQAQLHPHFLFNALNAVATLLRRDPRAAGDALTSFSDLLRLGLSQSDRQEVTLREDLEFVQRYVEIQKTRLGDRFQFATDVEPAALDCLVPVLLLQPLVENALRHGIEPSPRPGEVRVAAQRQGARLVLKVADTGVGLAASTNATHPPGIGLANLRARLTALYDGEQSVGLVTRPEGGTLVTVEIPAHENSRADS